MNKIISYILILYLLFGCNVLSEKFKTRKNTLKNTKRQITEVKYSFKTLPKDTVIFIPNIIYKDTTIIRKGKTTKLVLNYSTKGRVNKVQCSNAGGNEVTKTVTKTEENINEKSTEVKKEKITKVKQDFTIYFIIVVILLLLYLIIDKLKRKPDT